MTKVPDEEATMYKSNPCETKSIRQFWTRGFNWFFGGGNPKILCLSSIIGS